MKLTRFVCACFVLTGALALAQSSPNPIPFVNQPLVPMTAAPGGPGFTLTVNGTGFVSGAVVDWNGKPLATTFVSNSKVTEIVPAANIANAGTASVTVVNPQPGGGVSNVEFLVVSDPISNLTFAGLAANPNVQLNGGQITVAADFNEDGKLDLAYAQAPASPPGALIVQLGNGDGTFQPPVSYPINNLMGILSRDFNGDGHLDLAVVAGGTGDNLLVLLGNGDGTFQPVVGFATGPSPQCLVAGDFNGDGKLDLVTGNGGSISVLLGNGDGTFQPHVDYSTGALTVWNLAVGDFNQDGILDIVAGVACATCLNGTLLFFQGVGDGTFNAPVNIGSYPGVDGLVAADVNGDGKLDLVTADLASSATVFLGNGDGTFQSPVSYGPSLNATGLVAEDFHAHGKLDLALAGGDNFFSLLPGNRDGTFQNLMTFPAVGATSGIVAGDFNGDGKMDLAMQTYNTLEVFLQNQSAITSLLPTSLTFGQQAIGTTSSPQSVSLTNVGNTTLTLSSVGITGADASDFAQTNTCSTGALSPNASCQINVTFAPTGYGNRSAAVRVSDNAPGSPHLITLTGTAPPPPVSLSPSSVTFPGQYVGTSGLPQTVTLTNNLTGSLAITNVTASPGDFGVLNTCGSTVAAGNSCAIGVFFDPTTSGTRNGTLTVSDDASNSPQTVALTGTGEDFSMTPSSPATATVTPGQTASYTISISPGGNFNQTVTLSCSGAPPLSTCSLSANSIVLNGSTATPVTVTVKTTGTSAGLARPAGSPTTRDRLAVWLTFPGLAGLMLICAWNRQSGKRRGRLRYRLALFCLLSLTTWSACGGGNSGHGVWRRNAGGQLQSGGDGDLHLRLDHPDSQHDPNFGGAIAGQELGSSAGNQYCRFQLPAD
jgi:hypothetical protein